MCKRPVCYQIETEEYEKQGCIQLFQSSVITDFSRRCDDSKSCAKASFPLHLILLALGYKLFKRGRGISIKSLRWWWQSSELVTTRDNISPAWQCGAWHEMQIMAGECHKCHAARAGHNHGRKLSYLYLRQTTIYVCCFVQSIKSLKMFPEGNH